MEDECLPCSGAQGKKPRLEAGQGSRNGDGTVEEQKNQPSAVCVQNCGLGGDPLVFEQYLRWPVDSYFATNAGALRLFEDFGSGLDRAAFDFLPRRSGFHRVREAFAMRYFRRPLQSEQATTRFG